MLPKDMLTKTREEHLPQNKKKPKTKRQSLQPAI